jgi:recombination protein RecA
MSSIAAIRAHVEARFSNRVSAGFVEHVRPSKPTILTGLDEIDQELGGIPLGAITEVVGANCISCGQKSLQAQLFARATQERMCALIDATDSFDPKSAEAMGVNLRRLLWVRCSGREMKGLEQAFKCADLVLQATGGFGLIIVDVAGLSERLVRKVPLSTWFRFSRIVEKQETALVFSTPCAVTSTCSDLLLTLAGNEVNWSQTGDAAPTHARVFAGFNFAADLARKRSFKKPAQSITYRQSAYPWSA